MRRFLNTVALAGALSAAVCGSANAGVILSDNFDAAPLGLNWPGDAVFTSLGGPPSGPTTDLIGAPGFFDMLPGNGRYVDMDGSTGVSGILQSVVSFGPGDYTLSFWLAGNQRNVAPRAVDVFLGTDLIASVTLPATTPFTLFTFNFTSTGGGNLTFAQQGPGNNQGSLLDNVTLSVPEPTTLAMAMGALFSILGLSFWRRRAGA
ncbi:MAG: pyruvate-binding protein [Alphaproteobacteria bacterium]|nr:pyruvate-binding protein [Alphaproteobacteria bacterium]